MHMNELTAQVQELQHAAADLDTTALLRWLDGRGWIVPLDSDHLMDLVH